MSWACEEDYELCGPTGIINPLVQVADEGQCRAQLHDEFICICIVANKWYEFGA